MDWYKTKAEEQALADHPAGLKSEQQRPKKRDKGKMGKDAPPAR